MISNLHNFHLTNISFLVWKPCRKKAHENQPRYFNFTWLATTSKAGKMCSGLTEVAHKARKPKILLITQGKAGWKCMTMKNVQVIQARQALHDQGKK
jgi:hypothetical protein